VAYLVRELAHQALRALADERTLPTSTLARHFLLKAMEPDSSLEERVSRIEDELAAQRAKRKPTGPTRARRARKSPGVRGG
ncbi:MAG: hypothetical protein L0K86_07800, partial [Actinomycetia bacterium]|nr:hypothetical protein [Actinomycetes bacterium]